MEMAVRRGAATLVLATLCGGVLLAHHSFAMYDQSKSVVIKGTVTQFRWINPHSLLSIAAEPRPGDAALTWVLELSSPGNLTRAGWTRASVKPDDRVEVAFYPMKDGSRGGACVKVTFAASGRSLDCLAGAAIRVGEKPNLP